MYKPRPTNIVNERAFEGYDGLCLPRSPRTYLDGCADEFKDINIEQKLYHFGYLATRKVHFYRDLKDNIDNKMKNPQYQDYEDCAKSSFAQYLAYLRSGDEGGCFYYIYKEMPFRKLYLLLVRELKLRYYEYEDYDTRKTCFGFHN